MSYEPGLQVDAITALPTVTVHDGRAADCDLSDMILCWSRHERSLRSDLAAAIATDKRPITPEIVHICPACGTPLVLSLHPASREVFTT
jgi:ssDNA-binding Zn-finger/Zn-ribbon topoisomerase 1